MIQMLRSLFAQQTTPDEMVVFLLLVVLLSLLAAFLLYGLTLGTIWRLRHGSLPPLGRLLFPSRKQLRRHLSEYTVATLTSLLLMLTVAARDHAVRTVLEHPLDRLTTEEIQAAFPLGVPHPATPEAGERAADGADGLAASGLLAEGELRTVGVASLLRPTLQAAGSEHAGALATAAVRSIGPEGWQRFPTRNHLLATAILLLVGSAAWFAWERSRAFAGPTAVRDTEFRRIFRRLVVPAVCIALLLVSAAAVDGDRIARSTVAAALVASEAAPNGVEQRFREEIASQRHRIRGLGSLVDEADGTPRIVGAVLELERRLALQETASVRMADSLASAAAELRALRADLGGLRGTLARDSLRLDREALALRQRLDALDGRLAALEGPLREARATALRADSAARMAREIADRSLTGARTLGARLDSLGRVVQGLQAAARPTTGLLHAVIRPEIAYTITGGPPGSAVQLTGIGDGLHALAPGSYRVVSDIGSRNVQVRAGEAVTVRITQTVSGRPAVFDTARTLLQSPTGTVPPIP